MDEYLTITELSARIKFSKQSLYNLIHKGTFVLGRHYLKPTRKKILFKWSEILAWMGESSAPNEKNATESFDGGKITETSLRSQGDNYSNLINI